MLSLARLPDINAIGIAEALVGKQLVRDVKTYLGYVDMAREKIRNYQASQPKEEKPPRMKGQNIHFPVDRHYPKFWIKNIAVSGGEDKAQNADFFYATGNGEERQQRPARHRICRSPSISPARAGQT